MALGIKFTVKNYRCFSQEDPLVFEIHQNTITAFLGVNNSGKSTIFKFIYELREIWRSLVELLKHPQIESSSNDMDLYLADVQDKAEIFSSYNENDISIHFQLQNFTTKDTSELSFVREGQIGISRKTKMFSVNFSFLNNTKRNGNVLKGFFEILSAAFYIPAFRNAINNTKSEGKYYDLFIGTNFIQQWKKWRAGGSVESRRETAKLTKQIEHILDLEKLNIQNSENDNLLIEYDEGNERRSRYLTEMGSGLAQLIIVLGNLVIKKPSLILIDEPELNLHASLQLTFLQVVNSYSEHGTLFATHSIGLARSAAEYIYFVTKEKNKPSQVEEYHKNNTLIEMVGELSFSAWNNMGVKKILLCEGPTEVKSIQHFLRLLGKEKDILLFPLGGNSMIASKRGDELGELGRLNIDILVLIDSERPTENSPLSPERQKFVDNCEKLKYQVHTLQRRAFENYLTESAIQKVKGAKYKALAPFECLKGKEPNWSKEENAHICSKMTFDEIKNTDLGEFLERI